MQEGRPRKGSDYTQKIDGAKLSAARIAANLSIDEVAKHLNCNKSSISRWEQGKLNPAAKRVMELVILLENSDFVIREDS